MLNISKWQFEDKINNNLAKGKVAESAQKANQKLKQYHIAS